MNKNALHITNDMSQIMALKAITQEYQENHGFLLIDLSEVSFPLSRDFFLVLSRRLPSDIYRLILSDGPALVVATSLGIQTEMA
jgi:hypothetical protein